MLLLGAACASGEGEGSSFGGLSTASASSPAGTAVDTGSTANLTEAPDPTDDPATTTDPAARALLEQARAELGMVPNLYAALANLPALLETYRFGYDRFRAGAGLVTVACEDAALRAAVMNSHSPPQPSR